MQNIIISTLGNTMGLGTTMMIAPLIHSITTISTSIYSLIGHIKITKNTHQGEIIQIMNKTDIEATILLLQTIILDISKLPSHLYFTNNFILIALTNVKDSITLINNELQSIKEKMNYNNTLYFFTSMRSHDLLANLDRIASTITVLDRRCDYLFKCIDLCKHFTHAETPAMERGNAVVANAI
jgi:hypothetical protein